MPQTTTPKMLTLKDGTQMRPPQVEAAYEMYDTQKDADWATEVTERISEKLDCTYSDASDITGLWSQDLKDMLRTGTPVEIAADRIIEASTLSAQS